MKLNHKMELSLIAITSILCIILLFKLLNRLRTALPWRVNCWFCNSNSWVRFPERNCWTCLKCEQYNGFTKDGDYNKTLITASSEHAMTPKAFHKSPPRNGLCQMCNINQQLKVAQLANFVPMNDKNFDEEIEGYRVQLEKAYKLCSPCRKVVQMKLYKEKETLLGTKLLEIRTPEKKSQILENQTKTLKKWINNTSLTFATVLFVLSTYEFYYNLTTNETTSKAMYNVLQILQSLLERVFSILKMKILLTFPSIESYDINEIVGALPKPYRLNILEYVNIPIQESIGVAACVLQIMGNMWNVNNLKSTVILDLLWTVSVLSIADFYTTVDPTITSSVKMLSILTLIIMYKYIKKDDKKPIKILTASPKMKNLINTSISPREDDLMETDDDVSLCKFGLHNFSESSNETISPLNNTLLTGRCFTPRNDSLWSKPTHNSTFSVNTSICKSPSSISDTVFIKPTFKQYQNLAKEESDSDLDESISSLSLGGPSKSNKRTNGIFSLRKFTASPNFVTPSPMSARPLISPSKLSASWVAGGYWGSDGERHTLCAVDGSRSSSQSSGFESQTSSGTQRNVFSQPPSREHSVFGEPMVLDRYSTPVFPQMQFNGHVHIPQARLPAPAPRAPLSRFAPTGMFRAPTGLIRLPQVNSFAAN